MVKKHDAKRNKKTRTFKVKDLVTVRIPRIDRGGTDFQRLPGMVIKVSDRQEQFYYVLTQPGLLADCYRASDLEPYCGLVNLSDFDEKKDVKEYKTISLREAASIQSASIGSAEVVNTICNCAGKCTLDNRCKCFKRGLKCTSHCHLKMKKGAKKCCKNH
jgi:hypothetical protein